MLGTELEEMQRRNLPLVPFVCELATGKRLDKSMEQLATRLEFLPDEMVIDAEWQASRTLAREVEDERANEEHRPPAALFLRQARFAVVLRKMMVEKKISHLHATSSRALLCALILKKMLGISVSAAIEAKPELPRPVIQSALRQCVGGRISDPTLVASSNNDFILDRRSSSRFWATLGKIPGINLTRRFDLWQTWSESLVSWSQATRLHLEHE